MENLSEKLSAYVEMRQLIQRGPAKSWAIASDVAIERELAHLVLPVVIEGDFWHGTTSLGVLGTLKDPNVKAMRKLATPAPFGRGTELVQDPTVRDALEIPAAQLHIAPNLTREILSACNLHMDHLHPRVEIYKLHLYEAGGHFAEHKDTPHGKDHFMSGIVILGSPFEGGELVFSGAPSSVVTQCKEKDLLRVAAWYTDVPHSVRSVTDGTRVVLQFDVFIDPDDDDEEDDDEDEDRFDNQMGIVSSLIKGVSQGPSSNSQLADAIKTYWKEHGNQSIALLLRHQYLTEQLDVVHLKGADRALFTVVKDMEDMELSLEYLLLARTIPGGDGMQGEDMYAPRWGPLRNTGPNLWAVDKNVQLIIGPYVQHERATELDQQESAEHTGNSPMDGNEAYLFAALVMRNVGERPNKKARVDSQ